MKNIIFKANEENIEKAANRLKNGGLVAFPTETIYGLGADATNSEAVARIYEAKHRPSFNPLISHFADIADAEEHVELNEKARIVAENFMPGAVTMILPRKESSNVSLLCSAGLPTMAIRVPLHEVARELIRKLGAPIAAPSANRSGSLSPTKAEHVYSSLGEDAGMILASGQTEVGVESSILDMTRDVPIMLRAGGITCEDLEPYIGEVKIEIEAVDTNPKCPGQLLRHYAPSKPVRLNVTDVREGEALLAFGSPKYIGVEGNGFAHELSEDRLLNLSESADLNEAAANLFAMLHKLDKIETVKSIAVMDIPNTGLGLAINDRLKRAAEG